MMIDGIPVTGQNLFLPKGDIIGENIYAVGFTTAKFPMKLAISQTDSEEFSKARSATFAE